MAIYTKKGDKGKTSLFDKKNVLKSNIKIETYASVDELNSSLGFASNVIKNKKINSEIENIQRDLLEIGSSLALSKTRSPRGLKERPVVFEKIIDDLERALPPLKNFILPGGGMGGAALHISRAMARKSERRVVALSRKEKVDPVIIKYLNRLSDLLFVMARYINFQEKKKEKIWKT